MLGTAEEPIFCQPPEIAERYLEGFEKVAAGIEQVLTCEYPPVQPWPPWDPPPL